MEEKKTNMLSFRMTDEERALLERMAEKKKLSISSYVRMVLLTCAEKDERKSGKGRRRSVSDEDSD